MLLSYKDMVKNGTDEKLVDRYIERFNEKYADVDASQQIKAFKGYDYFSEDSEELKEFRQSYNDFINIVLDADNNSDLEKIIDDAGENTFFFYELDNLQAYGLIANANNWINEFKIDMVDNKYDTLSQLAKNYKTWYCALKDFIDQAIRNYVLVISKAHELDTVIIMNSSELLSYNLSDWTKYPELVEFVETVASLEQIGIYIDGECYGDYILIYDSLYASLIKYNNYYAILNCPIVINRQTLKAVIFNESDITDKNSGAKYLSHIYNKNKNDARDVYEHLI